MEKFKLISVKIQNILFNFTNYNTNCVINNLKCSLPIIYQNPPLFLLYSFLYSKFCLIRTPTYIISVMYFTVDKLNHIKYFVLLPQSWVVLKYHLFLRVCTHAQIQIWEMKNNTRIMYTYNPKYTLLNTIKN